MNHEWIVLALLAPFVLIYIDAVLRVSERRTPVTGIDVSPATCKEFSE